MSLGLQSVCNGIQQGKRASSEAQTQTNGWIGSLTVHQNELWRILYWQAVH